MQRTVTSISHLIEISFRKQGRDIDRISDIFRIDFLLLFPLLLESFAGIEGADSVRFDTLDDRSTFIPHRKHFAKRHDAQRRRVSMLILHCDCC